MIQETFPMIVGEEEVLNERELLVRVESGLMMDSTDSVCYIILHCSATRCNSDYTVEQLLRDHRARGFRTIGYHFYVRRDGTTDSAIFSRLLSEGLLLLAVVTPIALVIDWNLAHMELNSWRNNTTLEWDRLLLCAAISFVLIALMIAIGIGIPARKAMKVQPAEALHDD